MSKITVFISYSHDSDEHSQKVRALGASLARDGCECRIDVFKDSGEDWPAWMTRQLIEADFVLCVVTETYARRFSGSELPEVGLGVGWEAGLIRRLLYAKKLLNNRIFPVVFTDADRQHIPLELQGYDFFPLDAQAGYETLLRKLLNRPLHARPDVGTAPVLASVATGPLFARPGSDAPPPGSVAKVDLTRLTHAAEKLIGRETELQRLDEAWADPAQHVLIIRGVGGEGKTSLVVEWVNRLAQRDYDGAAYFDWSFYSQGTRDQTAASSDSFLAAALGFFGGDAGKALANSAASPRDKAVALLEAIRHHRTLLVLDGLEPLQYPPGPLAGRLRDDALAALLKGLAQSQPGLCVVTTREPVLDLAPLQDSTAPEWELERLSDATGADLLQRLLEPRKPKGVHQVRSTAAERVEICQAVKGHALTLRLLGGFIHRALRDVRRWREVDFAAADAQYKTNPKHPDARYGHAFTTIAAYEHWLASGGPGAARQLAVLRLLGLFDRPASGTSLAALRAQPPIPHLTEPLCALTPDEWNLTLSELEECSLVVLSRSDAIHPSLDAHPLLREYFGRQLREQQPEAWRAGHRRLYEHLCATTQEGDQPTLEALQPLYQAVAHGCQAGLQQEACDKVYFARIKRRAENYSSRKRGAFGSELGAVACFFETPWSRVAPALTEADQAWLLNQAAFYLRALGRLTEALEPMRASFEGYKQQEDWRRAAMLASNLSELELTLGGLAGAMGDAEQSVTYADRSGDAGQAMINRTTHADALHQAGRRAEAEARFRAAEQMQAERQPAYPLLYSLPGFRYCDLLLTEAERAVWQIVLGSARASRAVVGALADHIPGEPHASGISALPDQPAGARVGAREGACAPQIAACRAVSERAAQTLKIVEAENWLLDIALDHLTLGRAALYAAVLSSDSPSSLPLDGGSNSEGLFASGHLRSAPVRSAWLVVAPGDEIHSSGAVALHSAPTSHLESAVSGLRRAGPQEFIVRGLLTRAWQRSLTGARTGPESAQSDLDEAWGIAERGPMPLFLADIHLYRARLFFRETPYPWNLHPDGTPRGPADDLAEARRLIEKHGYLRRMEELRDAEAVLLPEVIEPAS